MLGHERPNMRFSAAQAPERSEQTALCTDSHSLIHYEFQTAHFNRNSRRRSHIAEFLQQSSNGDMADRVPMAVQLTRQLHQALACPAQR